MKSFIAAVGIVAFCVCVIFGLIFGIGFTQIRRQEVSDEVQTAWRSAGFSEEHAKAVFNTPLQGKNRGRVNVFGAMKSNGYRLELQGKQSYSGHEIACSWRFAPDATWASANLRIPPFLIEPGNHGSAFLHSLSAIDLGMAAIEPSYEAIELATGSGFCEYTENNLHFTLERESADMIVVGLTVVDSPDVPVRHVTKSKETLYAELKTSATNDWLLSQLANFETKFKPSHSYQTWTNVQVECSFDRKEKLPTALVGAFLSRGCALTYKLAPAVFSCAKSSLQFEGNYIDEVVGDWCVSVIYRQDIEDASRHWMRLSFGERELINP